MIKQDLTKYIIQDIVWLYTSPEAELGLPVEELVGHTVCRSCYEARPEIR